MNKGPVTPERAKSRLTSKQVVPRIARAESSNLESAGRECTAVVGSLTKTFACPGLRLGYLIADDVERFVRRQPAGSVGSLALAVLPDLLEQADVAGWTTAIAVARRDLTDLSAERGYAVESAAAPWVLVHATGLRGALAPHGVLVRDCASFGMAGVARVEVPDGDGLARLAAALDRVADTGPGGTGV